MWVNRACVYLFTSKTIMNEISFINTEKIMIWFLGSNK